MQLFAERQQNFGREFREFEREYREAESAARKELRETQTQVFSIMSKSQKDSFDQLGKSQKDSFDQLEKSQKEAFAQLEKSQKNTLEQFDKTQKESLERLDKTQNQLLKSTDERLENIRVTVAEKLDKTLAERLGKSFETVGKQLNEVQQGLGEMKSLAHDVGGLKKVLGNVKMRGGLGEIQLQMLLENILAPDQYSANVITRKGSREVVEFAVKLPGSSDEIPNIWLPIDAKFPKDVYEKLQNAYDLADPTAVEAAQKELDNAIKLNAKEISSKYVEPPYTTNFAIMFLPFEGIYAEVVRKADLLEHIQRQYNVIITGPTTLAAILNSLQIGFKTLAIQKRSSEVWETLGAVKTEFETFGGLLDKAKNKIQGGLNDMDTLIGTRTRAIQRKLRSVESLEPEESKQLLEIE
ncbi:MAG: DNA recombination protein RmuC [Bacteroidales bacterium]|nr:DNA recombination protein RmuC [Bacteroidales bacterium]